MQSLQGTVDLVAGGPPCQGFSLAGKRVENDSRNDLVHAYIEFVKLVKPKIVFFENVHGFTVPFENNKVPFSVIVKEKLERLGYHVNYQVIDVSKLGIPQKRKRFILIGSLDDNVKDFFTDLYDYSKIFLDEKGLKAEVPINEAISDLLKAY